MYDKEVAETKMIESMNLFKKNIRFLRKKANRMTLDEMAKRVGMSRDALFKIESRSNRYPNVKTIMKIAYFYDVSVGDLLEKDLEREEVRGLSEGVEEKEIRENYLS